MKHLKKLTMTLVALFAMTTGAWAGGIQGDVNADGVVDVADIAAIISVMNDGATYAAADVYADGAVNVADIAEVNAIIAGQDGKTSAGTKVVLKADDINVANGEQKNIVINMDYETSDNIIGLAFSLYLPDGILLKGFDTKEAQLAAKTSALKKACDLGDNGLWGEDGSDQRLTVMQKSDGGLLFVFLDQDDKEKFISTKAMAITISVHAIADVAATASIKNISITSDQNASLDCGAIANAYIGINQAAVPESVGPAGPEVTWNKTAKEASLLMPAGNVKLQVEYWPAMLVPPTNMEGGKLEIEGLTDTTLPEGFEKDDEGNIYVAKGTEFTVIVTPDEGYRLVSLKQGDTDITDQVDANGKVTIQMGDDDFELTATFTDKYIVTLNAEGLSDEEAANWKGATGTDTPATFPLVNVSAGSEVKATYTGTKKVIGVKAEKKSSAPTLKDALANGATVVITYTWMGTNVTTFTYTINGGTYTGNTTGVDAGSFVNGMSMEGTTLKFSASKIANPDANVSIDFYTDTNEYVISKGSAFTSFTISVNGTDLTSQLKKVK